MKSTLREIGITDADNITLTDEALDGPISSTMLYEGCEVYVLAGGEVVLNNPSGPTMAYDDLMEFLGGLPDAHLGDPNLNVAHIHVGMPDAGTTEWLTWYLRWLDVYARYEALSPEQRCDEAIEQTGEDYSTVLDLMEAAIR